jgi:hypothetical protein
MVLGMVDYGAFYNHEAQVNAALTSALFAGAQVEPADPSQGCPACVETATAHAIIAMSNVNQTVNVQDMTPHIERVSGTCALVLESTLTVTPLINFVRLPETFDVSVIAMLVHLKQC